MVMGLLAVIVLPSPKAPSRYSEPAADGEPSEESLFSGSYLRKRRLLQPPKMRGLYMGLPCGKQELQKRADALRPRRFIVFGTLDTLVMQIAVQLPSFAQQDVAKPLHVVDDARPLSRPNIQPDAR